MNKPEATPVTHKVNPPTNTKNIPGPIYAALCAPDSYDSGNSWRTVTELIDPPRLVLLKKQHRHEIVEDASTMGYRLYGHIVHALVEKAAKGPAYADWEAERRIFTTIRGCLISGQFDLFHEPTGELIDLKFSTVWKGKKGVCPREWEEQLNLLAALLRFEGRAVNKVGVSMCARDWSKLEAARDVDYPQGDMINLTSPLWDPEDAARFLDERVRLHILSETKEAFCTPEERWAKPDIFAIKKIGGSRAIPGGLYAVKQAAVDQLARMGSLYEIEARSGEFTRCKHYCQAAPFCTQYKGNK